MLLVKKREKKEGLTKEEKEIQFPHCSKNSVLGEVDGNLNELYRCALLKGKKIRSGNLEFEKREKA